MAESDKQLNATEHDDNAYIGNMWGWRFSFISLGIIVVFFILFLIKQWQESQVQLPD